MSEANQILDVLREQVCALNTKAAELKNLNPHTSFSAAYLLGAMSGLSAIAVNLGLAEELNEVTDFNDACWSLMKNYIQGVTESRAREKH